MSKKILNTIRGSGENITERAGKLTVKQCYEQQQANRVSYCIITRTSCLSESTNDVVRRQNRTMLWP